MIHINLNLAVALVITLSISLVFILWIFYNCRRESVINGIDQLRQCPYCTYIFFNYASKQLIKCPQCKSYLGQEIPGKYKNVKNKKQ